MPERRSVSRIAVAVDGFDTGRDAAVLGAALAAACGAGDVLLIAVLSDPLVIPLSGLSWSELRRQAEHTLAQTRDRYIPQARFEIVTDVSVSRGLGRVCGREHRDLLVLGSSPGAPEGSIRIGGRTRQLIGDAGCSLAIAPRGLHRRSELRLEHIGVGYDGGPEAAAALSLAGAIARAAGAELTVRSVVDDRLPAFGLVGQAGAQVAEEWEQLVRGDLEGLRIRAVEAAKQEGVDARVEAITGRPAEALIALGAEVDLLVIGSRRWGAIARLVLGSTGEALVHDGACPLLIVPRGREAAS